MGEMMSVRVGTRARKAVYRLAKASGRTQSDVVREAIEEYVAKHAEARTRTAYDEWKDVIGVLKGGPRDLSERTGEKVRRLLEERQAKRSR
jgi:hypothetical protein